MRIFDKFCLILVLNISFIIADDEVTNSSSGIHFEQGVYELFAEPSLESPYIFMPPKNVYHLMRTTDHRQSILECCYENRGVYSRYKVSTGFFLLRTNSSENNHWRTQTSTENEIDTFFNSEITGHKVFFYDQEYIVINKDYALCDGKILSPSLNSTGIFFLKRENPIYRGKYTTIADYYLLFYSFELDYSLAKTEFEKIASYIHCVSEGVVK